MATHAQADQATAPLRSTQRSRQVWFVLVLSLVAFLLVCGAVGLGLSAILNGITTPESATIKPVGPSSLAVRRHNTTSPEYITGTTSLQEGDTVTTGAADQAFMSLFGDSGTVQMYFGSQIEVGQLRATRFFQNAKDISLLLHNGTISFATGDLGDYASASYVVSTDQAEIEAAPDSSLRVSRTLQQGVPVTEVAVNIGSAILRSHGKNIDLGPQQMAWVNASDAPQGPAQAQVDLVQNGSFEEPPTSPNETVQEGGLGTAAWLPLHDDTGVATSPATVAITNEVNLKAAVLTGYGSPDRYVKVGITQDINKPASFFTSIELSATIKIVNQTAPAGGPANDVYPLTIRVVYTDQAGKNHEWKRSFYIEGTNPGPSDPSAIKIAQGRWTTTADATPNQSLFVLKSAQQPTDIAVVNAIEVYGYGAEFQSWITNISLMAR
jgi:hypothetical protein